jgi:hypothetical protein
MPKPLPIALPSTPGDATAAEAAEEDAAPLAATPLSLPKCDEAAPGEKDRMTLSPVCDTMPVKFIPLGAAAEAAAEAAMEAAGAGASPVRRRLRAPPFPASPFAPPFAPPASSPDSFALPAFRFVFFFSEDAAAAVAAGALLLLGGIGIELEPSPSCVVCEVEKGKQLG